MNTRFKLAEKADLPAILGLMEIFNSIDGYPFNPSLTGSNLERFTSDPNLGRLWAIWQEERIVGYFALTFGFSFEFKGRDAFLDELFLLPEYRNQGIGQKVLEFVFQEATSLQIKCIHLEVEYHNETAVHLYQKFGFKKHERHMMSKWI